MQRFIFIAALLLLTSIAGVAAQSITIKGQVVSADDQLPLIGATVKLIDFTPPHSVRATTVTDNDGNFSIISSEKERKISITYIGFTEQLFDLPANTSLFDMKVIELQVDAYMLKGTVVRAGNMTTIKGDTIAYNADSFKTNPDATAEDLIKKMPGVTTDSDGSVSAQGEKVSRVLVDGKEFFDDDPSFALKSLPSTAVASVEMYDDKTEEAKFSGFDDGQRVKTINIVTKAGVQNSMIGKAYVGYGSDDRYIAGARINSFKGDNNWTLVASTHNVGPLSFAFSSDGSTRMRHGGRGISTEGANASAYQTNANSQISKRSMIALNINKVFQDKLKLNASYRFGHSKGERESSSTQRFLTTTPERYNENNSGAYSINNSHNFYAKAEWTPNAKNKITITPLINYSLNSGNSFNLSSTTLDNDPLNSADNKYDRRYKTYSGSLGIWWQHAMNKPGRVLTLGGDISGNRGLGDRYQYSDIRQWESAVELLDTIDQIGRLRSSGYTLTGSATFSEQLSTHSRLSVNYNISYDRTFADQQGFNWNDLSGYYDFIDAATTNDLNRNYTTQTAGIGYTYTQDKKITLNVNMDYLFATQNNRQFQPVGGKSYSKNSFNAFQPRITLRLNPKFGHNININVSRYASFPAITQMQDVLDLSDPLKVFKGNPNLDQSYSTRLMMHYNMANVKSNIFFTIMAFATQTSDYVASHRQFLKNDTNINGTILKKGTEYTTYENLNGLWNAMAFTTFSFVLKPIKSNINIDASYRFNRQPSIQDNIRYVGQSHNIGFGVGITSNISEKIDFTVRYRPSITYNRAGSGSSDRFKNHNLTAMFNIYLTKNLFINSDASWVNSYGTQASYSQHYALVNAAIGYKFMKKRQAEFKVQVYDLFNKSQSLRQSMTDTYISTSVNRSILQRFFMFSFTYNIQSGAAPSQGQVPSGHPRMRHM